MSDPYGFLLPPLTSSYVDRPEANTTVIPVRDPLFMLRPVSPVRPLSPLLRSFDTELLNDSCIFDDAFSGALMPLPDLPGLLHRIEAQHAHDGTLAPKEGVSTCPVADWSNCSSNVPSLSGATTMLCGSPLDHEKSSPSKTEDEGSHKRISSSRRPDWAGNTKRSLRGVCANGAGKQW